MISYIMGTCYGQNASDVIAACGDSKGYIGPLCGAHIKSVLRPKSALAKVIAASLRCDFNGYGQ